MADLSALDYLIFEKSCRSEYAHGDEGPDSWNMNVMVVSDTEDSEPDPVLWMDGWTFRLGEGLDLAPELDAVSADTAVFMPLVDGDGLADTVDGDLFGTRLVLINHVSLDHAWRGHGGVGRYLTGLAIPRLDSAAACVALHASPFELRKRYSSGDVPADEWEAGAIALGKLWKTIGFKHHSGHLYVLDPSTLALDEAVDELKSHLMQDQE